MEYFELEMHGDYLRVEWNGKASFNIQETIDGQWVDFDCFTCYGIENSHDALECAHDWINENIFEFQGG